MYPTIDDARVVRKLIIRIDESIGIQTLVLLNMWRRSRSILIDTHLIILFKMKHYNIEMTIMYYTYLYLIATYLTVISNYIILCR